jgi:WD40 repeat protein/serine/threonine protein kinase
MTRKNASNDREQSAGTNDTYGTQAPRPFSEAVVEHADARPDSTPPGGNSGSSESAESSPEQEERNAGFGTLKAPPLELAEEVRVQHRKASGELPSVVHNAVIQSYSNSGDQITSLSDAIRTCQLGDNSIDSDLFTDICSAKPSAPPRETGRSSWNLQIRQRDVAGQISGIINQLVAESPSPPRPESEMTHGIDAAEYEVLDRIAAGNMGVIYQARQTSLDRELVIKTLKPESSNPEYDQALFVSEAVVTANLVHPNIVPIHDLGQTADGKLFYSMKHVLGMPWNKTMKALTLEENLDIFNKVCDAVAYAHSRGVINRDLKPENVMIGEFGEVIVLDWGLAITTPAFAKQNSVIVEFRGAAGTPVYMAPEMLHDDVSFIGTYSDVYLLGAILFEILEGFPPHLVKAAWTADSPDKQLQMVFKAVLDNEIESDVVHTGEMMQIARRAMSTEPEDRYSSVERLQDAIREYRITGRAEELTRSIEDNRPTDYDDYQSAVALFSEAIRKWPDNRRAADGSQKARVAYARLALSKGDYDLGLHVVSDRKNPTFRPIHKKLKKARSRRQVIRFTWSLLFVAAITLTGFTFLQDLRLTRADAAVKESKLLAEQIKDDADKDVAEADRKVIAATALAGEKIAEADERVQEAGIRELEANDAVEAAKQKEMIAVAAAMDADDRARIADTDAMKAEDARKMAQKLADDAKILADAEKVKADAARAQVDEAVTQKHEAQLASHLTRIDTSMELGLYDQVVEQVDKALLELKNAHNPKFDARTKTKLQKQRKVATARQGNASLRMQVVPGLSAFSGDGNTVATVIVGTDQQLQVWHREDSQPSLQDFVITTLSSVGGVSDIGLSTDGTLICAVGLETRKLWRRTGNDFKPLVLETHETPVMYQKCLFSPDGKHLYLIANDDEGTVEIYDVQQDAARLMVQQPLWKTSFGIGVEHVALLPDESALIVESQREYFTTAFPIQWDNGKPHFKYLSHNAPQLKGLKNPQFSNGKFQVESMEVSPDGTQLALVSIKNEILVLPRSPVADPEKFPFVSPKDIEQLNYLQAGFPVRRLLFSRDGQRIATLHENRYIQLWDQIDGRFQASNVDGLYHVKNQTGSLLQGHSSEVLALTFADDSRNDLLSISKDRTLRSWDLTSYAAYVEALQKLCDIMITSFSDRPDEVSLHIRPGPTHNSHRVPDRLLNRDYRSVTAHPQESTDTPADDEPVPVSRIALAKTTLADMISISQGRNVFSARFSVDGDRLLVGSDDLAAHVFDSKSGLRTNSMSGRLELFFKPDRNNFLEGHVSEIASIRFLPPDGDLLLTSDYFGSISVWDAAAGADGIGYEKSRLLSEYSFSEFAVSDDGEWIVAGGAVSEKFDSSGKVVSLEDATLNHMGLIWRVADMRDVVTAKPTVFLDGQHPRFAITAVGISPDDSRVVTAGRRGRMVIWDRATGEVIATHDGAHGNDGVSGVFFTSEEELISSGFDGRVLRWTIRGDRIVLQDVLVDGQFIVRLRPSPDRSRFAVSDIQPPQALDGTARVVLVVSVFDVMGKKQFEIGRIPVPPTDPELAVRHDVSWSLDGSQVLFTMDGILTLFDTSNWKVVQKYQLDQGNLKAVRGTLAPTDKGEAICAATFDGRFAHLWNLSDGSHLAEFRTHSYRTTASFSFDRRFVATASETVRIFESDESAANHGQTLLRMQTGEAHSHPLSAVAFSPRDGDYRFASEDQSGEVKLWNWSPDDPATTRLLFELSTPATTQPTWGADYSFGNTVAWRSEASMLATVQEGVVSAWKITEDGPEATPLRLPDGFDCRFNQVAFSRTMPLVVASGVGYSMDTGRVVSIAFVWRIDPDDSISLIGVAEGGHSTVSRSRDQFTGVTSVAIDDSADELLTGGADGKLIRWQLGFTDAETPEELSQIVEKLLPGDARPHERAVTSIDVAADGRVVSGDEQGQIHIWPSISQ